jgi:hypothetical protein
MNTAGKAVATGTAAETVRVRTALSPNVQRANEVGAEGVGVGVHTGLWVPGEGGEVVDQVEAAKPSANTGDTR